MAEFLEQQQLVEPPARRRLIVPAGSGSSWWGVDPGVGRVALGFVGRDGRRGACTAPFADLKGGARLAEIWRETRRIAIDMLCVWPRPGLVWVEQPSGSKRNLPLEYATGVIQAALFDALGCAVETVASSSWKLTACGRGNIYKPDPKKNRPGPYGVLVWAQANGYNGWSWDEADAFAIAEAARREVMLEER